MKCPRCGEGDESGPVCSCGYEPKPRAARCEGRGEVEEWVGQRPEILEVFGSGDLIEMLGVVAKYGADYTQAAETAAKAIAEIHRLQVEVVILKEKIGTLEDQIEELEEWNDSIESDLDDDIDEVL